jgi:hypothetical protein
MTLYVAIFVPLALLALVEAESERFRRRDSQLVSGLFLALFWLLSWLRWERGTDWNNYRDLFENLATNHHSVTHSGYEWGYATLNYVVRSLTDNYTVLLFVVATIAFAALSAAILRSSRRPIVSTFVLFCLNLGSIYLTRQGIATAFGLLAVACILRERKAGFFLALAAGALFHYSIVVFLPAWWIYRRQIATSHFVVAIVAGVVFALVISRALLGFMSGLPGFVGVKLAYYLDAGVADFEGFGQSFLRVLAGGVVNRGGLLLLALLIAGRERTGNPQVNGVINLYAFNFVLFIMMAPIAVSLTRLAGYYEMTVVFLIPMLYDHLQRVNNRRIVAAALTVYLGWRLFSGALGGTYGDLYVPYNTIFTKERPMITY